MTQVKSHKRVSKNKVSVVRSHARKQKLTSVDISDISAVRKRRAHLNAYKHNLTPKGLAEFNHLNGVLKSVPKKKSTEAQKQKARERHWKKTGVSGSTVNWMKNTGNL